VIYNLITGDAIHLDMAETESMSKTQNGEECTRDPVFLELCDMGWGFISENRYYIDKLRSYNNLLLLRPDLKPPTLRVAFLQLNNECNYSYQHCRSMFCTPCRQAAKPSGPLSLTDWREVVDLLHFAGAEQIVITGGDVTLYDGLKELIDYIVLKPINVSVILNPQSALINKIPRYVPLKIYLCTACVSELLIERFAEYNNVSVLCNEEINADSKQKLIDADFDVVSVMSHDIKIQRGSLTPCYLGEYFNKKDNDNCLNGKMYIDSEGQIVPCFQSDSARVGSVLDGNFQKAYRTLVMDYWKKPVSHVKCNDCEWHFGCPVCAFMIPERQCAYNIETGKWA
jgi:MoaA/NifB/PqqE/SkfB family radical SAM enzyme